MNKRNKTNRAIMHIDPWYPDQKLEFPWDLRHMLRTGVYNIYAKQ